MFRFIQRLVTLVNKRFTKCKAAGRTRVRPELCQLEDRVVPTVSFEPVFGGFTRDTSAHNGVALSNTQINLIFEGSYWNSPTDITQQDVIDAVNNILNSAYTDGLTQYGALGRSSLGATFNDTSLGTSTDNARSALLTVANSFMSFSDVFPTPGAARPMYFVVTAPNVTREGGSNGGFHDSLTHTASLGFLTVSGSVPYGCLGIDGATRAAQIDVFSNVFSHELAEGRTDPYLNTVSYSNTLDANRFFSGAQWGTANFDEIADFEPDGRRYLYRLPSGTLVEPYWSETPLWQIGHGTFIVPDGNWQAFTLRPNWTISAAGTGISSTFLGTYDLEINGDQLANKDDTIRIDTTRDGGVSVTLNGETVSFDVGKIRNLNVDARNGDDTINLEGLPDDVQLTIYAGGQSGDSVNITSLSGNAARIGGSVYISGGYGQNTLLTIDDSDAPLYRQSTFEVNGTAIIRHDQYSGAAIDSTITYYGFGRLSIYAGSQTKDVAVNVGAFPSPTRIGVIGNGHTSLTTNDPTSFDSTVVYSLAPHTIARTSTFFAPVTVDYSNVTEVTINAAPHLGATYNIPSLGDNPVNIYSGPGPNTFNVGNETDGLGQIVQLNLFGNGKQNNLVVDDRASVRDPSGFFFDQSSTFDLSGTSAAGTLVQKSSVSIRDHFGIITFTSEAHVSYSGVQNVSILAGSVANTFKLIGPDPGIRLGKLAIQGGADTDTLILDDSGIGQSATYRIGANDVRRITQNSNEDLKFSSIDHLQIIGPSQGSVFNVKDAPDMDITTAGEGPTTINVDQTTKPLNINSTNPGNVIVIGGGGKGDLSQITGAVTIQGVAKSLSIKDAATTVPMSYAMDATHFSPTSVDNIGYIDYGGLSTSNLAITLGNGGNLFYINGTPTLSGEVPSPINIVTGNGSDSVHVSGTGGDINVDLGKAPQQTVNIGDAANSLDAIHGRVNVSGGGTIDAFVSNAASTQSQTTNISSVDNRYQTVERTQFNVDHNDTLNSFSFTFNNKGRLTYSCGQAGETVLLFGTPAQSTTTLNGGPGLDVFWIESDNVPCLGPVFVNGTVSQGDFAYYYDYFNQTSQTYTFQATPSNPANPTALDQQVVKRPGAADITYKGMSQIVTYLAQVGGNQTYIKGVPAGEFLNMVIFDRDNVTLGANGSMANILGDVDLGYGPQAKVILDDSADATARNIVLHPKLDAYGDFITGMAPGGKIYLRLGDTSSVALLGGKGSDSFALAGTAFTSAMRIDGGKGVNTLDYSNVTGLPGPTGVYVNLVTGTATGLAGGISRIQNVTGSPFNDILVGNGGNVLNGGAGRDILIAGAKASTLIGGDGEDVLIGGTTAYDTNRAALDAVMAEWASADPFSVRVGVLQNNLLAGKVTSNGGRNTLLGKAGPNLFFKRNNDTTDLAAGDAVVNI